MAPRVINRTVMRMVENKLKFDHHCLNGETNVFKYEDLIRHLKNECESVKTQKCPLKCENQTHMNMGEVKEHLINECKNVEVECHICYKGLTKRTNFERHSTDTCIKGLQETLETNLR